MMRGSGLGILLAVVCVGGTAVIAQADLACLVQAKANFKGCRTQCSDDYKDDKFRCRNILPACGNACLAGREVCLEPINDTLDTCLAGCKTTLQQNKLSHCNVPPPCAPGDTVCDGCVDNEQIQAFICRDTCREDFRANHTEDVKLCREAFRACVHVCPPAP
jgi:hypothetical protein